MIPAPNKAAAEKLLVMQFLALILKIYFENDLSVVKNIEKAKLLAILSNWSEGFCLSLELM